MDWPKGQGRVLREDGLRARYDVSVVGGRETFPGKDTVESGFAITTNCNRCGLYLEEFCESIPEPQLAIDSSGLTTIGALVFG